MNDSNTAIELSASAIPFIPENNSRQSEITRNEKNTERHRKSNHKNGGRYPRNRVDNDNGNYMSQDIARSSYVNVNNNAEIEHKGTVAPASVTGGSSSNQNAAIRSNRPQHYDRNREEGDSRNGNRNRNRRKPNQMKQIIHDSTNSQHANANSSTNSENINAENNAVEYSQQNTSSDINQKLKNIKRSSKKNKNHIKSNHQENDLLPLNEEIENRHHRDNEDQEMGSRRSSVSDNHHRGHNNHSIHRDYDNGYRRGNNNGQRNYNKSHNRDNENRSYRGKESNYQRSNQRNTNNQNYKRPQSSNTLSTTNDERVDEHNNKGSRAGPSDYDNDTVTNGNHTNRKPYPRSKNNNAQYGKPRYDSDRFKREGGRACDIYKSSDTNGAPYLEHNDESSSLMNHYDDTGVSNNNNNDTRKKPAKKHVISEDIDLNTQRGQQIYQLARESYECMVCMENVRLRDSVWSCDKCCNAFHLRCIRKWSNNKTSEGSTPDGNEGWRCPACQNVAQKKVFIEYRCFCGKVKDPAYHIQCTPHSCGELCLKNKGIHCPHNCNILCHPGLCPPCTSTREQDCDCKTTRRTVRCGTGETFKCSNVCEKLLNCGSHFCSDTCHSGACTPCAHIIHNDCHCGKKHNEFICGSAQSKNINFSCDQICDNFLKCSRHRCVSVCHPGECSPCALDPDLLDHCPCGGSTLSALTSEVREICSDPVACCNNRCGKPLKCGSLYSLHECQLQCHQGACFECDGVTDVSCSCGSIMNREIACKDLVVTGDKVSREIHCKRMCKKKMNCGKHKCQHICCDKSEHMCDQRCGHRLTCGLHYCEEFCHGKTRCTTCWNVGFSEVFCYCGLTVKYPPVPCGTTRPICNKSCTRQHSCTHTVAHSCHDDDEPCAPCTELVTKPCMCGKVMRKNTACHLANLSCGLVCHKPLNCGHACPKTCHMGDCSGSDACKQLCTDIRSDCKHRCNEPCHRGKPCPSNSCRHMMELYCACKLRSEEIMCLTLKDNRHQRMLNSMSGMDNGGAMALPLIETTTPLLNCNDECLRTQRNNRIALALQIKSPHIAGRPSAPQYAQFLLDYTKRNKSFVEKVEKYLTRLVQTAQESTKGVQHRHAYSFPAMNKDQRHCIHELAYFYGISTESFDNEPNKNVAAFAYKNKCYLPTVKVSQIGNNSTLPVNGRDEIRAFRESLELSSTNL